MIKWSYTILIFIAFGTQLHAQNYQRPDIDIQAFAENLFQTPDEDVNYDDLYESLYQLYANPINLNNADKEELSTLFLLNNIQINALLDYLANHGPMLTIYELQVIDGFDLDLIQSIAPFVEVRSLGDYTTQGNLFRRMQSEENNYFVIRTEQVLETQEGYTREDSSRYLGSPAKIYGRVRSNHSKDFSVGLTFEKDPGERVIYDKENEQYGFDYYSYHLFLENKGNFKKIAIGDYQMQFGQGLILGAGFSSGKGAETITTVKRANSGIKPYTSALESGFMRGVGITYQMDNFQLTPFYSYAKKDAVVLTGDEADDYEEFISSIQDGIGMRRTYNEISANNNLTERTFGMNITYEHKKSKNFEAGLTFIHNKYSLPLSRTPNNYNQFEFQGSKNYNIGLFANYNWQNFLFFMEMAQARSGGRAFVGGFMSSLSPIVSISFSYRNYAKDYHSMYGNSFGEGTRIINETGLYWGIKITPSRRVFMSAYYDKFQFPWLKFGVDSPSAGHEYLIRVNYKPTRKITMYVQWREQAKQESISQDDLNTKVLYLGVKRNLVGNLDFSINDKISIKSRAQYSTFSIANVTTKGMAIIQDLNLKLGKWVVSSRVALFDSEDYENRQYVYEKNLQYVFSIPAYSGQGIRNYLMLRYKPNRDITIWGRIGRFNYFNITSTGSGLNEIEGSTKTDVKLQIRYKF